jgi:hypothetical protein
MNLSGAVPGERLVWSDGVDLDPELLCLTDQVERDIDRFELEPLVPERLEAALPDGRSGAGS